MPAGNTAILAVLGIYFGLMLATGVWVGGLVTVAYTAFGGFKGVAYTDAVQAMLMLFALLAVPLVGVAAIGAWVTLALGVAGCLVALFGGGMIFSLVLFAWSGLGAAFGPVVLCVLHWRGTTGRGVVAGMAAGFATSIGWVLLAKEASHGLYEMVPAFVAGLLVTVVVSRRDRSQPPGGKHADGKPEPGL